MKKYKIGYYLLSLILIFGFLFHESEKKEILNYSYSYIFFIVVLLILIIVIPFAIRFVKNRIGLKIAIFSVIPTLLLIILIYTFFHFRYYAKQKHLFDPFLQVPPPEFAVSEVKDTNEFRIIMLGGSTTRCAGLDAEKRYPYLLEKILQKQHPQIKVRVLNAGMDWYTTKHSLINYITYCSDYYPDLVIVMHAFNDMSRSFSPKHFAVGEYLDSYSHFYGPSINGAKPPTFEKHIITKYKLNNIINFMYRWFDLGINKIRNIETNLSISEYKSQNVYKENIKKILYYCKMNGAKVAVVCQPSLYKENNTVSEKESIIFGRINCSQNNKYPSSLSLYNAMKYYNELACLETESAGMLFIDTEKEFPKTLDYFVDDVHYTNKGASKLARIVSEELMNKSLLVE